MKTDRRRAWVIWPIGAAVTWVGSLVWASSQAGIGGVAMGLALSAVITTVTVSAFLWLDRWKRGRPRILVSAFVWGASVAAFGAIWSQQGLQALVDTAWGPDTGAWVRPLIITPVTEEVLKALFLLWLLVYRRREIAGVVDAIVVAGLVGAGFSFTENSLYLGRPLADVVRSGGTDAAAISILGVTLFIRVLLVPFFHYLMVALTAIGVGIATRSRGRGTWALPVATGLLAAIFLHGIWDWAGLASGDQLLIFRIYGTVMVPVFLAVLISAAVLRHREARLIAAGVPSLVRDADISLEEAEPLISLRARRQRRAELRRNSGWQAARAFGRYQAEASALALRIARDRRTDREQLALQRRAVANARAAASAASVGRRSLAWRRQVPSGRA
jgi:RsiW-degrading membrane proteinase PrsW (M82 family)